MLCNKIIFRKVLKGGSVIVSARFCQNYISTADPLASAWARVPCPWLDPASSDWSGEFVWRALRDKGLFMTGRLLYWAVKMLTISNDIVSHIIQMEQSNITNLCEFCHRSPGLFPLGEPNACANYYHSTCSKSYLWDCSNEYLIGQIHLARLPCRLECIGQRCISFLWKWLTYGQGYKRPIESNVAPHHHFWRFCLTNPPYRINKYQIFGKALMPRTISDGTVVWCDFPPSLPRLLTKNRHHR
jgi:hypothetical protein